MRWPSGLGAIIALIVLVLAIVFMAIGQLDYKLGFFIVALAASRLC